MNAVRAKRERLANLLLKESLSEMEQAEVSYLKNEFIKESEALVKTKAWQEYIAKGIAIKEMKDLAEKKTRN